MSNFDKILAEARDAKKALNKIRFKKNKTDEEKRLFYQRKEEYEFYKDILSVAIAQPATENNEGSGYSQKHFAHPSTSWN